MLNARAHVAISVICITGLFLLNIKSFELIIKPPAIIIKYLNYSCVCSDKQPTPTNGSLFGFYNSFEADADTFHRITKEQIDFIDASHLPFKSISYTYFGQHFATYKIQRPYYWTRSKHSNLTGNEGVTLQALYDHCLANQNDQVMYFHSKGTYHVRDENDLLRQNLMKALVACYEANALLTHDTCGLRISPAPFPQYSGNMWLASCRYIARYSVPLQCFIFTKNIML
jgi:hypothetical protein